MRLCVTALLAFTLTACNFAPDPDGDRFACEPASSDCEEGARCVAQLGESGPALGGYCFRVEEIQPETCNGADDDRNGLVDDSPTDLDACTAAAKGQCVAGVFACEGGERLCVPGTPTPEACNGLDDDCDGETDEGEPLLIAGSLDKACAAGAACVEGVCVEQDCADGMDDDADGLIDCADPDCDGQTCRTGVVCAGSACP